MQKKTEQPAPLVMLADVLKAIPKPELRAGFAAIMKPQYTIARTQEEWDHLLTLFKSRPIAVPWTEWVTKGAK